MQRSDSFSSSSSSSHFSCSGGSAGWCDGDLTPPAISAINSSTAPLEGSNINNNSNVCIHNMPYNPHNVLLDANSLSQILTKYGNQFPVRDINLYRKALTHRSYCTRKNENFLEGNVNCPRDCLPLQEESNERLEYLGDAVLNLVVASYLFERYPDENEGFLTRMRTKLVNGIMLAQLCKSTGIDRFFVISRQIEENNGRRSKKVLEDCFEAFLGAMFVDAGDNGFQAVQQWLIEFLENNIDFPGLVAVQNSYKGALTEYLRKSQNEMPKFVDIEMPSHQAQTQTLQIQGCGSNDSPTRKYTVCVMRANGMVLGTGTAATKKEAENEASRKALAYCGQ